jgi:phage terminase large subunit GpA-like protein
VRPVTLALKTALLPSGSDCSVRSEANLSAFNIGNQAPSSPTTAGLSRIGKEYASSDQRKCFLRCPHCDLRQILTWENVRFSKDEVGNPLPKTSQISCGACGALWTERERIASINELMTFPDHGWRQTAGFICCGEAQVPETWDDEGRSLCHTCGKRSAFDGKAGFNCSKLYSKRHRLEDIVQQWMEARGDIEQMRVWTNEAMGELFEHKYAEKFSSDALMARAEPYGPSDLPPAVKLITGFVDAQANRLEVLVTGWSWDEEQYVILHHVIHGDPGSLARIRSTARHDIPGARSRHHPTHRCYGRRCRLRHSKRLKLL